jgi:hypothetical protein
VHPSDEQGATMVIVVLSLVAMIGMIVLTVDVGQLLFKRRGMVNASDAAALAAAQSCAGLDDFDDPEAMADAFAIDNVNGLVAGSGSIIDQAGCDSTAFGHVTVEYWTQQDLFFAGVLGFDGPATVRTRATAGWGPAGAGNPLPIVIYAGDDQGTCDIREDVPKDISCYLWYDNDMFGGSSFGFLNLCTETDPCRHGWDVDPAAACAADRSDVEAWVSGTWNGGPNEVNFPDPTYVCRVSGLAESIWQNQLAPRVGQDLMFPVNDCDTQVDDRGDIVGCDATPHKYNIIGFIILRLDRVLDDRSDWEGDGGSCETAPIDMTAASPSIDLDVEASALGCTPYDTISNVRVRASGPGPCCTEDTHYVYDPDDHIVDWIDGNKNNVRISWDYAEDGPCGPPPSNSSAVCLQVTTVEPRFGGSYPCPNCPDFGVRAIKLCDLEIGSCPRNSS